jgi:hypothetical protein
MSADSSGIYIARFPIQTGGLIGGSQYEYRVAYAYNIERCEHNNHEMSDYYQVLAFIRSKSIYNRDEAWLEAKNQFDKYNENGYLKYGVSEIHFNKPLLSITYEEAEKKIIELYDNKNKGDVHTRHCSKETGCKYGDENCTVALFDAN